jgi:hypothetical protein
MKVYDVVFFWLGGVLAPTLPELTMAELTPELHGHGFVHTRQQLQALAEEAALGKIDGAAYCAGALKVCRSEMAASTLEQKLITAASIRQPLAEMIGTIPSRYECWLVVDYPPEWYQALADRGQIESLFPASRQISTAQLGILSLVPDLFYRLPQAAKRPLQGCIIIDGNTGRAVQSVRNGLASIYYVYLQRLKLELALQEILPTSADVMHPTSSERVKL